MLSYILLEASAASPGIDIKQIILIAGFVLVFYFFMIRPQQKRQKNQRDFLTHLKKGDAVVTIGGIHGKIYEINDPLVTIQVDDKGTKLTFSRTAISIEGTKKVGVTTSGKKEG
jgi:preprotein translocase subunit YajC